MSRETDKAAAVAWARELMSAYPLSWVILDTETTALKHAEVLQIGLLWPDGVTALDVLMEPDFEFLGEAGIPSDATAIHHITNDMVRGCPTLNQVLPVVERIIGGRLVVIYNSAYDEPILHKALEHRFGAPECCRIMSSANYDCAMLQYAKYIGETALRGGYRWQRLPDIGGGPAHSAIGDCRSTLELIRRMAKWDA